MRRSIVACLMTTLLKTTSSHLDTGAHSHVPVAAVDRNGFDESIHYGTVVVFVADSSTMLAGHGDSVIYPRSSLKPLQAQAMIECGLSLTTQQLAVGCASHDGSAEHLDVVRSILTSVGLEVDDLRTTPDLPFDREQAERILAGGGERNPLQMNCSGKHAAMLATCQKMGWTTDSYLDLEHPLQQAIISTLERLSGQPITHIGVDGCGAPTHALPMSALARAIAQIADERGAVWNAMTSHPVLVGGPSRPVTRLMQAVPGLLAKDGAEGVMVAALPGGPSIVVKVSDGASRAAALVAASALRLCGVDVPSEIDRDLAPPALGGGEPVGRVRSLL